MVVMVAAALPVGTGDSKAGKVRALMAVIVVVVVVIVLHCRCCSCIVLIGWWPTAACVVLVMVELAC